MSPWHYSVDGQQHGPMSEGEIRSRYDRHEVPPTAMVWTSDSMMRQTAREAFGARSAAPARTTGPQQSTGAPEARFFHIDTSVFVVLTIASAGLFSLYWMYQNRRYLRDHGHRGTSPFWRTFFNIFWVYDLFSSIKDHPVALESRVRPYQAGAMAVGYIVMMLASSALSGVAVLPWGEIAAYLLGTAFILPVQCFIVRVNASREPQRDFSKTGVGLVVVMVLGFLVWIGTMASIMNWT